VFPPAGGTKGVKAVASILSGRDEELPIALFDSDAQGRATAQALRTGLYAADPQLVLEVGTFTGMPDSEIEDLIPPPIIAHELDRWQRTADVPFADVMEPAKPIVPQIESWAKKHGITLETPGWKVELAKRVKQRLLAEGPGSVQGDTLERWTKLFEAFQKARASLTNDAAST